MIRRYRCAELLKCPSRRRMVGDVNVDQFPCAQFDDHEDIQNLEHCGDDGQEIAGHDGVRMVANEGRP